MSTAIKTKLTRYIYNINGNKIENIKGVFDKLTGYICNINEK